MSRLTKTENGKKLAAVVLMILSAFSFASMQLMIKLSNTGGTFSVTEQAFFRNSISLVFSFAVLLKRRVPLFGSRDARPLLFARSFVGLLAIFALFFATNHASIADSNILNKLSPAISTLLAVVFLKETAGITMWASIAVSFAGAWVVCGPSFSSNPIGMLVALLSAVLTGVAHTLIAALKKKADPLVTIFCFSLFSVAVCGVLMIPTFVVPTASQFVMLVLIGVFGSCGQVTLTYSLKLAPAVEVSIYNYAGIIWAALLGWLFLDEVPALNTLIGGALVVAASLIAYFDSRRKLSSNNNK